jgi:hypothetical protein
MRVYETFPSVLTFVYCFKAGSFDEFPFDLRNTGSTILIFLLLLVLQMQVLQLVLQSTLQQEQESKSKKKYRQCRIIYVSFLHKIRRYS